jgi:RNA polymerase sigma-70 factor (ECF subfamily)
MTATATNVTVAAGLGGRDVLPAHELSEQEVVLRARDGDHSAFRVLVKRHESRVYALAMRILHDPEWAQDAVQESFLKAYRSIRKFEGRAAFGTWMYRLTYNQCLDMKRADKSGRYADWDEERTAISEESKVSGQSLSSSIRGPGEEVERGELREQLGKAIETLPEAIRQTLVMREIDGLPYGEIAELLEIPKGTVMSRLFHARKRLQEVLREQGVLPSSFGAQSSEDEVEEETS